MANEFTVVTHALGWVPEPTRRGGIKAVGTAEHQGRVLYGAEADHALHPTQGAAPGAPKEYNYGGNKSQPAPAPQPAPTPAKDTGEVLSRIQQGSPLHADDVHMFAKEAAKIPLAGLQAMNAHLQERVDPKAVEELRSQTKRPLGTHVRGDIEVPPKGQREQRFNGPLVPSATRKPARIALDNDEPGLPNEHLTREQYEAASIEGLKAQGIRENRDKDEWIKKNRPNLLVKPKAERMAEAAAKKSPDMYSTDDERKPIVPKSTRDPAGSDPVATPTPSAEPKTPNSYMYRGTDAEGNPAKGTLSANSHEEALAEVANRGHKPSEMIQSGVANPPNLAEGIPEEQPKTAKVVSANGKVSDAPKAEATPAPVEKPKAVPPSLPAKQADKSILMPSATRKPAKLVMDDSPDVEQIRARQKTEIADAKRRDQSTFHLEKKHAEELAQASDKQRFEDTSARADGFKGSADKSNFNDASARSDGFKDAADKKAFQETSARTDEKAKATFTDGAQAQEDRPKDKFKSRMKKLGNRIMETWMAQQEGHDGADEHFEQIKNELAGMHPQKAQATWDSAFGGRKGAPVMPSLASEPVAKKPESEKPEVEKPAAKKGKKVVSSDPSETILATPGAAKAGFTKENLAKMSPESVKEIAGKLSSKEPDAFAPERIEPVDPEHHDPVIDGPKPETHFDEDGIERPGPAPKKQEEPEEPKTAAPKIKKYPSHMRYQASKHGFDPDDVDRHAEELRRLHNEEASAHNVSLKSIRELFMKKNVNGRRNEDGHYGGTDDHTKIPWFGQFAHDAFIDHPHLFRPEREGGQRDDQLHAMLSSGNFPMLSKKEAHAQALKHFHEQAYNPEKEEHAKREEDARKDHSPTEVASALREWEGDAQAETDSDADWGAYYEARGGEEEARENEGFDDTDYGRDGDDSKHDDGPSEPVVEEESATTFKSNFDVSRVPPPFSGKRTKSAAEHEAEVAARLAKKKADKEAAKPAEPTPEPAKPTVKPEDKKWFDEQRAARQDPDDPTSDSVGRDPSPSRFETHPSKMSDKEVADEHRANNDRHNAGDVFTAEEKARHKHIAAEYLARKKSKPAAPVAKPAAKPKPATVAKKPLPAPVESDDDDTDQGPSEAELNAMIAEQRKTMPVDAEDDEPKPELPIPSGKLKAAAATVPEDVSDDEYEQMAIEARKRVDEGLKKHEEASKVGRDPAPSRFSESHASMLKVMVEKSRDPDALSDKDVQDALDGVKKYNPKEIHELLVSAGVEGSKPTHAKSKLVERLKNHLTAAKRSRERAQA